MIEPKAPPVSGPGLYRMSAASYHADPCPIPSLNHGVARILHEKSAKHAWNAHPRLGGEKITPTRDMSIGSVVHTLAIGRGAEVIVLDFDDYRKDAAKGARDTALSSGYLPVLRADYEKAQKMAGPMREAIESVAGGPVETMLQEIVAIGCQGETWFRSMLDVTTPDLRLVIDAKTTANVEPEAYGNTISRYSATAVAFYFKVLDMIDPDGIDKRRFVFVAQERDCPEAITYHELDPEMLAIASGQMGRAILKWQLCQSLNQWPSYPRGPHLVSPKPWDLNDELDAQYDAAQEAQNT